MTPSDLKYHVSNGTSSYFFERSSMKFAGDTMRNYGVRAQPVSIKRSCGEVVTCWELYRRRPVKHGLQASTYFSTVDFSRIHGEEV